MFFQKVISRIFVLNEFFVGILRVNDENNRIRIHLSEAWIEEEFFYSVVPSSCPLYLHIKYTNP
jgi:hypothetical protein